MPDAKKNHGPYVINETKVVYENPWIHVREDKVSKNNQDGVFGIIEMKHGSTVLAVDEENNVFLTKEFKYAINKEGVELVSGGMDDGESPLDAAKRELQEELGLVANEWIDLGRVDPFTMVVNSPNYIFLARDIVHVEANRDHFEDMEVMKIPFEQAYEMVVKSEITHGASCVAILKSVKYVKG